MRDAQAQASNAATTAATTAGAYGSTASGIGANLVPFLTRQMTNPQGMSQRDIGAQLTSALAGTGGATAGLNGAATAEGMRTRNPMGFSAALDTAARMRDKGAASSAEGIAARNADVKLQQQGQAAGSLGSMYGTAGRLGVESAGQVAPDVNSEMNAAKYGWMQQIPEITKDVTSIASLA